MDKHQDMQAETIPNRLNSIGRSRLIRHALFWIGYIIVWAIPYCSLEGDCVTMLWDILLLMPVKMGAVYFSIYVLLPKYLLKRKYPTFFFLFFFSAILFGLIHRAVQFFMVGPLYYPEVYMGVVFWDWSHLLYGILNVYTIVAVAAAIKLLKQSYNNQQKAQQLANEKLDAELKLLKAQIHPHFLFNTLNNLYALALDQSERTAEGILKLSNLLDYMLYECNVPYISLDKEINLIENFIELEKLRYGDRLDVAFIVSGKASGKLISPMLILPFVENSFKHGSSTKLENTRIRIELKVGINAIDLEVENSKSENKVMDEQGYSEGIGLNNVKRRLDLIYPNRYDLLIEERKNVFKINLHLDMIQGKKSA